MPEMMSRDIGSQNFIVSVKLQMCSCYYNMLANNVAHIFVFSSYCQSVVFFCTLVIDFKIRIFQLANCTCDTVA
jgi:hypothetical protein